MYDDCNQYITKRRACCIHFLVFFKTNQYIRKKEKITLSLLIRPPDRPDTELQIVPVSQLVEAL